MKQILILAFILFGIIFRIDAASYEEAMGENIQKMYTLQTNEELTAVANQFERIGAKETGQWLPGYYAAYSYVMIIHRNMKMTNEEKSKQLDKAQTILEQLVKDFGSESEIFALQGLVYQMRVVDSSTYSFSMKSGEALGRAEKLNPNNPRIYYLKGTNTFYTPVQFGGGAANAKPLLEKAINLFQSEKTGNPLLPSWGKEHCMYLLDQCGSDKAE